LVSLKPLPVRYKLVPNVMGMGLKDAVFLLNSMGIRVNVVGWGTVRG